MTRQAGVALVKDYLQLLQESSRVAAAEAYLAADADISINGTPLSVPEYMDQIRESDRHFQVNEIDIQEIAVDGNTVIVRMQFHLQLKKQTYGIQPTGETFVESGTAFHEIGDDEVVGLHITYDRMSTLKELGLLSEDPTTEKLRDQYFEVLNRVLRHNLRNDLNVIQVTAEQLRGDREINPIAVADQIEETAQTLLGTVEKARRLERMAIDRELEAEPIRLSEVIEEIVDWYDVRNDVDCYGECDSSLELTTDRRILETVLTELVENAVQHADAEQPAVTVAGSGTDGGRYAVELSVLDNGSGIPETELEPIREGEETKLLHGSGIGLWVVDWCVTRLDGDVRFDSGDGCRVRILLPDL